ncbi:hypothetical protein OAF54_03080 [bacterium]|nr:hypothetical protein [bacterium]
MVKLSLMSSEEIEKLSVVEISNPKIGDGNDIYDGRLGVIENLSRAGSKNVCATCNNDINKCPGHFGHINLNYPIINSLYYDYVGQMLKCFCYRCSSVLINKNMLKLLDNKIEHLIKVDSCFKCFTLQPKIVKSDKNIFFFTFKFTSYPITTNIILSIFSNISDEDIAILALNFHPKNLILTKLPVLPICSRPPMISDGVISDDDISNQYIDIIKLNNSSLKPDKKEKSISNINFKIQTLFNNDQGKAKYNANARSIKSIKERISGKYGHLRRCIESKRINYSARTVISPDPTLSIDEVGIPYEYSEELVYPHYARSYNIEYLRKKLRDNQVNYITSNGKKINLKLLNKIQRLQLELKEGDILDRNGSQKIINISDITLQDSDVIIRNGKNIQPIKYLEYGDTVVRKNSTIEIKDVKFKLKNTDKVISRKCNYKLKIFKKKIEIKIGDLVELKLQNGDIGIVNRQPTLHKGSIQGKKVRLIHGKTMRINLATTASFNAD